MKSIVTKALILSALTLGYVAAPFVTAWSIREAVRNGDSAYLERAIDWPGVRASLAPDINRLAFDLTGSSDAASQSPDSASTDAKPSLWKRFKAYMGQGAVNRAIDNYLTPEGLPRLFAMRKAYRDYVSGEPEDARLPVIERMKRAWSRVKRAEFTGLTTFEVDMADKMDPNRVYLGKLALGPTGWVLRELRVRIETSANQRALRFADGSPTERQGFMARARAAARIDR